MRLRHLRVSAKALCVAIVATLAVTGCEWGTFHGNRGHTGDFPSNTTVRTLQKSWSARLDGAVYASPLVHQGLVYVATEGGSVYAFTTAGALRWRTHLADPVRLSDLAAHGASCGNIDPLGITGTPVYDPTTNRLFAVAETLLQGGGGTIQHHLVALNATTGAVLGRRLVPPPRGNEAAHQQRGALAITAGRVLVPYGGLSGDCGSYVGSIVGTRIDLTGAQVSYAIPTTREGAFWNTPGPLVLPDGSVLEASGNGASTGGTYDGSDSVVHLSADLHTLLDRFAPTSWADDNAKDQDLGSMGPVVTSNGYVVQSGKRGITYVLRLSHLGGFGGQVSSASGCTGFGGAAVSGTTVYLPCTSGVQRADISTSGAISIRWHASGVPGSPVVYGNSVLATSQSQERLYVMDPATGQARSSIAVGPLTRFATPALDTGRAYVGTMLGIFAVNLKP